MDYTSLINELLRKRGLETEQDRVQFLHPTLDMFHNPFLLNGMKEAVERIKTAIERKERIVIYGDYDCDGISAVSILYLYFSSIGLTPIGFIPSRHTDGYGLSEETVNKIKKELNPSLVITVDTGISAHKEVEMLKSLGIDVIVTDHHEPPEVLPKTIVVDPKIKGQDYPFDGLSGAGVAFKLVQALSDINTALEYVDIACISTVGDIVPLLDENRLIVKLGLERINSKNPRPAIGYLKNMLKLGAINSTDIAFKVVPRLNACGRISTAEKCFKFMVSTKGTDLETIYKEMEEDNNLRLNMSAEIFNDIDEVLKDIDLNKEPAVFIRNDNYNLGLIGIIASKLVGMLNRPVFIFTSSEDGALKASVRSIEGIDIFKILDKNRDLMVDVGGHSLAGGLTILPENYNKLKTAVLKELQCIDKNLFKYKKEFEYDAEITEADINMNLASKIDELEPFGFMNPKPVFKLCTKSTNYTPLKSIKHYKVGLHRSEIVSFFGDKLVPAFLVPAKKDLIVTLEVDTFFSKPRAKAMLKSLKIDEYSFPDEREYHIAKEIYYYSKQTSHNNDKFSQAVYNDFGTIIITDSYKTAQKMAQTHGYSIALEPNQSGESVVLYNPHRAVNVQELSIYKNIIIDKSNHLAHYLTDCGLNVSVVNNEQEVKLDLNRENFKNAYILITKALKLSGNNFFEIVESLEKITKLSPEIISATCLVAIELGFYELKEEDGVYNLVATPTKAKKNLEESNIYNKFK